jgi:hypothetical protein
MASHHAGDWSHAEALLEQSQQLWQLLGDRCKALARLRNRAQCWARQGRLDEAQACFEHCERLAREDGDAVGQIDSLLSLSSLLSVRRRWSAALEVDRRCVALCWQRWSRHGLGYALWNPPRALARLRRPEPAMRLMGFAATFWQASFGPLSAVDRQTVRRVRALVRAAGRGACRGAVNRRCGHGCGPGRVAGSALLKADSGFPDARSGGGSRLKSSERGGPW